MKPWYCAAKSNQHFARMTARRGSGSCTSSRSDDPAPVFGTSMPFLKACKITIQEACPVALAAAEKQPTCARPSNKPMRRPTGAFALAEETWRRAGLFPPGNPAFGANARQPGSEARPRIMIAFIFLGLPNRRNAGLVGLISLALDVATRRCVMAAANRSVDGV
jgi:hypothetical protein